MKLPVLGMTVTVDGAPVPVDGLFVDVPDVPPPTNSGVVQEVGSFVPIIGGTGGESGQAYSSQHGHYCRTGRKVDVWTYTQFSARGTIVGDVQLKNLPFPTAYLPGFFGGVCSYSSNLAPSVAAVTGISLYAGGAQQAATLYGFRPGGNPLPLQGADLNDHTQLILCLSYLAD